MGIFYEYCRRGFTSDGDIQSSKLSYFYKVLEHESSVSLLRFLVALH